MMGVVGARVSGAATIGGRGHHVENLCEDTCTDNHAFFVFFFE